MPSKSNTTLLAIIIVLIIAGVILALVHGLKRNEAEAPTTPSTISSEETQAAQDTVRQFGAQLRLVSLLAPQADVDKAMDTYYAPFVSADLLTVWKNDPSKAPGRQTSSPFPESIEIASAQTNPDGTISVEGNVNEVVNNSATPTSVVATYPVSITLQNIQGRWMITSFQQGIVTQPPKQVNFTGTYLCLPHRDTSGPQTLECALGMQTADKKYYALDLSGIPGGNVNNIPTGSQVNVKGTLTPIEAISSDQWQKYQIDGIIRATTFQKVNG